MLSNHPSWGLRAADVESMTCQRVEEPMSADSPPPLQPVTPKKAWYRRGWVMGLTALSIGFVVGHAAGGGASDSTTAAAAAAAAATPPTVTVTQEATQPAAVAPETVQVTAPASTSVVTVTAPAPKPARIHTAKPAANGFPMPSELGNGLQDAQDALQAASGDPFYYTDSTDALGAHRFQILDDDWQVCTQTPAAGTMINEDSNVSFGVVKLDESCP
jgi:hypothetical protein